MPEAAADHGRRRLLQGPACRRDDDVVRAVLADQLLVGVLAGGDGVEKVPFGKDSHAAELGIDDHRGADPPFRHQPRRFPQRVRRADGEDHLGHALPDVHVITPLDGGWPRQRRHLFVNL